ncbi:hypothetical protein FRB98_003401 [Tulasnella sp. 332]|nr:hypothetical protein FRB98_003401 [Tulasnella sp. 332]
MRISVTLSIFALFHVASIYAAPIPQNQGQEDGPDMTNLVGSQSSSLSAKDEGIIAGSVAGGVLVAGGAAGAAYHYLRKKAPPRSNVDRGLASQSGKYYTDEPKDVMLSTVEKKVDDAVEVEKIEAKQVEEKAREEEGEKEIHEEKPQVKEKAAVEKEEDKLEDGLKNVLKDTTSPVCTQPPSHEPVIETEPAIETKSMTQNSNIPKALNRQAYRKSSTDTYRTVSKDPDNLSSLSAFRAKEKGIIAASVVGGAVIAAGATGVAAHIINNQHKNEQIRIAQGTEQEVDNAEEVEQAALQKDKAAEEELVKAATEEKAGVGLVLTETAEVLGKVPPP